MQFIEVYQKYFAKKLNSSRSRSDEDEKVIWFYYNPRFSITFFSGPVECIFDNLSKSFAEFLRHFLRRVWKLFAQVPEMKKTKILEILVVFKNSSGHEQCSFDIPSELFSANFQQLRARTEKE